MHRHIRVGLCAAIFAAFAGSAWAAEQPPLTGTEPLTWSDDLADRMMASAHRFVDRKIAASPQSRQQYWTRDLSSPAAYDESIAANRERFCRQIGAVDPRLPVVMRRWGDDHNPALVAETETYRVWQVEWPVLEGVSGEGLLLEPKAEPKAAVIALSDADQTPEQLAGLAEGLPPEAQFARRLAENGFLVIAPALIDRSDEFSGKAELDKWTNQPHREWIYRQAFHMGRHVIGYEVQKVMAAVDWLEGRDAKLKIGVAGYAEGGLLAFYAAAADPRIDACLVSGYFDARERVWQEPIYRNVWALLHEFGDAEIASLVAPRALVVEYSTPIAVDGPPQAREGRRGAAAGKIQTPAWQSVRNEFARLEKLVPGDFQPRRLLAGADGAPIGPGSRAALAAFAEALGVPSAMEISDAPPADRRNFDPRARQERQVRQLEAHVQSLVRNSDRTRDAFFLRKVLPAAAIDRPWNHALDFESYPVEQYVAATRPLRDYFWTEVMGKFDDPLLPPAPKTRQVYDRPGWTGYEVVLDVWPDVFAWGILLVPKGIAPGERRPVVVCQHGRNGLPTDSVEGNKEAYRDFAARLADEGFVVFSPHNLYRGEDAYRWLDRKANNVKATLFSFILGQHDQLLRWLETLPFVDGRRMAFYGLSYGGETAVRVPAILERYCLSICSGDFNEWSRKVASTDYPFSFMFTMEWEMPYFDLGNTVSYAEMAYLIAPRPFMVERGYHDGVGKDPWVAYEYAKVRWLYTQLGLADRTEIEYFNGGHAINAQGTFAFLRKHLAWPADSNQPPAAAR